MLMPLARRSRVGESKCHTGHFSLIGTYLRLSTSTTVRGLLLVVTTVSWREPQAMIRTG
jgi:hypothetical protein